MKETERKKREYAGESVCGPECEMANGRDCAVHVCNSEKEADKQID